MGGFYLSAENKRQMWIPPGFAYGFLVLSQGTLKVRVRRMAPNQTFEINTPNSH
jgi:dTDP-4-dehydrorhamnose 3,5-epimerase-like enzyme